MDHSAQHPQEPTDEVMEMENQVFVSLGSNLGDREAHLQRALVALGATHGIEVLAASPVYETDPVGPPPQGAYLNGAVQLRTALSPSELLDRLLEIEVLEGRSRGSERDVARTLDLDLLLYGEQIISRSNLEVPHPRLAERAFVLTPLGDLASDFVHPVLGESIGVLAARVCDPLAVRLSEALLRF